MTKFLTGQQEKQTPQFYPRHLKFSWSHTESTNSIIFISHSVRFKSLACSFSFLFFFLFLSETSCCPDRHFPAEANRFSPGKRQVSPLPCCYACVASSGVSCVGSTCTAWKGSSGRGLSAPPAAPHPALIKSFLARTQWCINNLSKPGAVFYRCARHMASPLLAMQI